MWKSIWDASSEPLHHDLLCLVDMCPGALDVAIQRMRKIRSGVKANAGMGLDAVALGSQLYGLSAAGIKALINIILRVENCKSVLAKIQIQKSSSPCLPPYQRSWKVEFQRGVVFRNESDGNAQKFTAPPNWHFTCFKMTF